jgi:cytochrome oxidase assembly protein ShyY1
VLVVLVTFSAAGVWQLRRAEQREAQSAVVGARMTAAPLTLAEARALAADDGEAAAGVHPLAYRRVRLEGTFDASAEVLKRPVARDGTPGYHVVTPLVVEGGSAVLVERGWVPQTHGEVPVTDAPPRRAGWWWRAGRSRRSGRPRGSSRAWRLAILRRGASPPWRTSTWCGWRRRSRTRWSR